MRWMGLDFGERRIGIAFSDPLELTAQAYAFRERSVSLRRDLEFFHELIHTYEVEGVVLGLPKNMNGSEGPMAEKARVFGQALAEHEKLTVVYWDERLSTNSALRILLEADLSRRKRRVKIDQLAAAIVLQNFLDSRH